MTLQEIGVLVEVSLGVIGAGTLIFNTGVLSNKVNNTNKRIEALEEIQRNDIKEVRDRQNEDFRLMREKIDKIYEFVMTNVKKNN